MKKSIIFSAIALMAMAAGKVVTAQADPAPQMVCRPLQTAAKPAPVIEYESTLIREDVTRVSLKIKGQPHTANRIDGATLLVNDILCEAFDIDGVEFTHYFQWEDEGEIPLEIDFPPIVAAHGTKAKLHLNCIYGDAEAEIIL